MKPLELKELTAEEIYDECVAKGYDCSQVVFAYAAERLGLSQEQALKIAAGFGGGMWRGDTCGCVTGALMAIGLKYGHYKPDDQESKDQVVEKVNEFTTRFTEEHDSLICHDLLGYKLPEELPAIMEENLFQDLCPELMVTACEILDDIL